MSPLYSLRDILIKFEVSPQPFEPVFTLIRESRFNSFCWAVLVVWFLLVGSHSSELRTITIYFVRFLTLLEKFWKILRASLNDMDWFENQINRFI